MVDRLVRYFIDEAKTAGVKKNNAIAEGYQITDKNFYQLVGAQFEYLYEKL